MILANLTCPGCGLTTPHSLEERLIDFMEISIPILVLISILTILYSRIKDTISKEIEMPFYNFTDPLLQDKPFNSAELYTPINPISNLSFTSKIVVWSLIILFALTPLFLLISSSPMLYFLYY